MNNVNTIVAIMILILSTVLVAQEPPKESVPASSSQSEIQEVKNYKEFMGYVAKKEKLAVQRKEQISLKPGESIRIEREGVEVSLLRPSAQTKSGKRVFLGEKSRVAVVDPALKTVHVLDGRGIQIREGKLAKLPDAKFAFSDSRFFLIGGVLGSNGGFEVYDYDGVLKKSVNPGYVGGFSVSNTQAYLALTASSPKSPEYFLLYDMDGTELFRHEIRIYADGFVRIAFSSDDKYVALDIPEYWRKKYVGYNKGVDSQRRRYVFDVEGRQLISEEDHD